MTDNVSLVRIEGPTSIYIEASIDDGGDLVVSGQDVGEAPLEYMGDSDYEYALRIRAAHKDDLLLALLEKLYSGDARVVSELREYLEAKGIPAEFSSF